MTPNGLGSHRATVPAGALSLVRRRLYHGLLVVQQALWMWQKPGAGTGETYIIVLIVTKTHVFRCLFLVRTTRTTKKVCLLCVCGSKKVFSSFVIFCFVVSCTMVCETLSHGSYLWPKRKAPKLWTCPLGWPEVRHFLSLTSLGHPSNPWTIRSFTHSHTIAKGSTVGAEDLKKHQT